MCKNDPVAYLRKHVNEIAMAPNFHGSEAYYLFLEKKIILPGDPIRTVCGGHDGNFVDHDESYQITKDGSLEGIDIPTYPGLPGIHSPEEILSEEHTPGGWQIDTSKWRIRITDIEE
jgi:hypothetical protein